MHKTLSLNLPISIKHSLVLRQRFSLKLFWILGFISIITLLGICIFQVIAMTTESYLTATYEKRITELSQENKDLQILISQQNSLGDLEKTAEYLNFEPVTKIHYIEVLEGTMVTK